MPTTPIRIASADLFPVNGDDARILSIKELDAQCPGTWNVNLASAVRTVTTQGPTITRGPYRKVIVSLNMTTVTGLGVRVYILGFQPLAAVWFNIASYGSLLAAPGVYQIAFGENASNTNQGTFTNYVPCCNTPLSEKFAIYIQHQDGNSLRYEVDYELIP